MRNHTYYWLHCNFKKNHGINGIVMLGCCQGNRPVVMITKVFKMGFTGIYNSLIPARFLTLLAHVLILVVLLWDQVSR